MNDPARKVIGVGPVCETCGFEPRLEMINLGQLREWTVEDKAREHAFRCHLAHETRELLESVPLSELQQWNGFSDVIEQYGTWAVTHYGVECLTHPYSIERERLRESDWIAHMAEKTWVLIDDFTAALTAALRSSTSGVSLRQRFEIFRRDGYRCQMCGDSAVEGARLEVDHKIPKSKGGNSHTDNLWTLCFRCNRGKSNSHL